MLECRRLSLVSPAVLLVAAVAHAAPPTWTVPDPSPLRLDKTPKARDYHRCTPDTAIAFQAEGPGVVALFLRPVSTAAKGTFELTAVRDMTMTSNKVVAYQVGKLAIEGGKVPPKDLVAQIEVPTGKHTYELLCGGEPSVILVAAGDAKKLNPKLALSAETPLPPGPDAAAATPPPVEPTPAAAPSATSPAEAPAAVPTANAVATPAPAASTPAVEPAVSPIEAAGTDLRGRVRLLADHLHQGFAEHAAGGIHRVAVLDFDPIGVEALQQRLGPVVAEVLLTEISRHPGVVVVERAKLKELVGELKLQKTADLDPRTATEIGKFLGAASMIVGSVSEAGAEFIVSARQVSVETAAVIQAESVAIDRGELVALSKDLVEIKSRGGAALRSTVLPGWGQIYNGDTTAGTMFLGSGVVAAVAAGTFATLYKLRADSYHDNTAASVPDRTAANRYATSTNGALGVYAAVWVGNILHAYFTGRDAETVRTPEPAPFAAAAGE